MGRLRVVWVLFLLASTGCTSGLSREITAQADTTITFKMLLANPDAFAGKLVILGGTIDQLIETDRGTLIEVVQKPLDYWGKPRRTSSTGGRFFALSPRHLDPLVFAPGRNITIGAEIAGTRPSALPEQTLDYPLVIVKELKLWELEHRSWSQPQWMDPLYDPGASGRHDW